MDQVSNPSSSRRLHLTGSRDPGPTLTFDQPNPDPDLRDRWQNVFATLSDYFESSISLDSAIGHAAHHCEAGSKQAFAIYDVAMVLGDQIPFVHTAQSKLGQFLIAFYESDEWSLLTHPGNRQSTLERVSVELAEDYIDPDGRFDDGEDPMDFVNGSAFIANVIACDKSHNRTRYLMLPLGHIMDASFCIHPDRPRQVHDAWVMGAAQHIIYSRAKLWELTMKADRPPLVRLREKFEGLSVDDDDPKSCLWAFAGSGERDSTRRFEKMRRDIYSGGSERWPYNWDQWAAWKAGFRAAASNEIHSDLCRRIAEEAAGLMDAHERQGDSTI